MSTRTQALQSLVPWEEQLRLLETVPGIDRGSACAILIELGPEVGAFRSAKHLAAWARVAPGNHKSAGKRLSRRTRKGNPALKTTLVECALGAARTHGTQFHSYHKARKAGGRYKQATMAKAHKMLRISSTRCCATASRTTTPGSTTSAPRWVPAHRS